VGASGDLSIRICLLGVWFSASVLVCVMGSCLLKASVYGVFAPLSFVPFSLWPLDCVVAVCSSSVTLLMSPLMFSRRRFCWRHFP